MADNPSTPAGRFASRWREFMSDNSSQLKRKRRWPNWLKWLPLAVVVVLLIDWALLVDFSTFPVIKDLLRKPAMIPWLCAPSWLRCSLSLSAEN